MATESHQEIFSRENRDQLGVVEDSSYSAVKNSFVGRSRSGSQDKSGPLQSKPPSYLDPEMCPELILQIATQG